jgi:hypothetical protein
MRLALALALAPVVAGVAVVAVVGACGGSEFIAASDDGGVADAPVAHATASFCELEAGTHTFCDDFDNEYDGATLTDLWPIFQRDTGAIVQDDSTIFVSSPNSLESSAVASGGTLIRARVGHVFGVASSVTVAFDFHLDKDAAKPTNTVGGSTFFSLVLGANYALNLSANSDVVDVSEDQTLADASVDERTEQIVATTSILGTWVPVVLQIDLSQGRLTGTVNGATIPTFTISPPGGLATTVYMGLSSRDVISAVEAHYDNVTIDVAGATL